MQVLLLDAPRSLYIDTSPDRPLGPGEIRLKSIVSGISHGTELNTYRGTSPFNGQRFDEDLRAFVPSDGDTNYPMRLGYEMISRVVETGPTVCVPTAGDIVHSGTEHRDATILNVQAALEHDYPLTVLPSEDRLERGLFISLGSVALQGIHDARIKLGDTVAVFGLGTVGLLTVQMARLSGAARVFAVDPVAERRETATALGADAVLDPSSTAVPIAVAVKQANSGEGVDVSLETSGTYPALQGAIGAVAMGGRVVAVGYYQGGATDLRLGEEWHHNRVEMVCSMGVWNCPHRDYPLWTRRRLTDEVVRLLFADVVRVDSMDVTSVAFTDASTAYQLIDREPSKAIKVALRYE